MAMTGLAVHDLVVWTVFIAFVLWLVFRRRPRNAVAFASWSAVMPAEIRNARLVASELKLAIMAPVRLRGATDQVYQAADGRIVLVENKRSMHLSGIAAVSLQLGLCRLLLRYAADSPCRGAQFADHAWVHVTGPHAAGGRYVRVMLPTEAEALEAYHRYIAVRRGTEPRARTVDHGLCERVCPHHGVRCDGSRGQKPMPGA